MQPAALARPSFLGLIPAGPAGTRATLQLMAATIRAWKTDPMIRGLALRITARIGSKQYTQEADQLRRWVRANITYRRDVHGVETVQTPGATLELAAGDCDDQAVLLGALAQSIGFPVRLVAIGPTAGRYQHVFVEMEIPGRGWTTAETTENVPLGYVFPWTHEMVQPV